MIEFVVDLCSTLIDRNVSLLKEINFDSSIFFRVKPCIGFT